MKNIFAAGFFALLFMAGCNNPKKEKAIIGEDAGTGSYSITAPQGWTKTDTILMGRSFTILKSPTDSTDTFMENMNVVSEKVGDIDQDKYVDKNIADLQKQLTSLEMEKTTERTINGNKFSFLKFSHVYNSRPMQGECYITIKKGVAYVITCSTDGGEMSKWEPSFEEAIKTFKAD
jgi:hypothetical protein